MLEVTPTSWREDGVALQVRCQAALDAAALVTSEARELVARSRQAPWRSVRRLTSNHVADLRTEVEGLREAMASRAIIEQAKGIVMASARCDADHAFELLVQQSQHENRKLRDVAAEVVAHASGTQS